MKRSKTRKPRANRRKKKRKPGPAFFLKQLAESNVLLPNRPEVLGYARRHADLAALLPGIAAPVREFFGPDVELSLELYKDPEINDRYLTLYLRQQIFDPDLIDRIDEFRPRFYDELNQVSGHLLITTDYRKPRGIHAV